MSLNNPTTTIKIDLWSVLKISLVFLMLWFLYIIRDIILLVLIAFFLSIVIIPVVDFFERKKFPRWLGALIVYLIIFGALVFFGFLFFPVLISQGKFLFEKIPDYLKSIFGEGAIFGSTGFWETLKNWLTAPGLEKSQILSFFGNVISGLFSALIVFIISFYLSVDKDFVVRQINKLSSLKYKNFLANFYQTSQKQIGAWARASLLLCLLIGVSSYLGLVILDIKFALLLGVMTGVLEIIPYLGPWISGVIAFLVALSDSPFKALMVVIFYLILQQLENNLISPQVMRRAIGLNPVVILVVLMIGGKLAGPLGALLSIPLATILSILLKDYLEYSSKLRSQ